MLSSSQRLKHLLTLVVVLICCLAVGLLIHHNFVVSTISRSVQDAAVASLAAEADPLFSAIERMEPSGMTTGSAELERVFGQFRDKQALPELRFALTDLQWQVFARAPSRNLKAPQSESPDATLTWTASTDVAGDDEGQVKGLLRLSDGRHVAVARRLPAGRGYAVVHYPFEKAEVPLTVLSDSLPLTGVITWLWISVLMVVVVYMINTRFYDASTKRRAEAEAASLRRIHSLVQTRDAIIFGLAQLADSRDEATGRHLERISAYAGQLAAALRHHPSYREVVTADFIQLIGISSALHDIGKVGIEDAILLKPGPLTESQRLRMQQHSVIGGNCILEIERRLGTSNFLQMARAIAFSHHERFDGTGYPEGLIGKEIPLAARIVALADDYEALSSPRVYKKAFSHEKCVQMIRDESGKHFDPVLVEAFMKIEGSFRRIACQYGQAAPVEAATPSGETATDENRSPEVLAPVLEQLPEGLSAPVSLPEQV